jgi:hypothetical protein
VKVEFPPEFVAYLKSGKPVEGELKVAPGWYVLWAEDEIEISNKEYEVSEYAPNHLGFGSSGGGEMLAFNAAGQVVMIPFIGMSDEDAIMVAKSWSDFEQVWGAPIDPCIANERRASNGSPDSLAPPGTPDH